MKTSQEQKKLLARSSSISSQFKAPFQAVPNIALALGLFFFLGGLWQEYSSRSFIRASVEADVIVIKVEEKDDEDGRVYRSTFAYEAEGQNRVVYTGNTWVSPKPHEVGDTVPGYYNSATGEISSREMHDLLASLGRTGMTLGGALTLFGTAFLAWRRYKIPPKILK